MDNSQPDEATRRSGVRSSTKGAERGGLRWLFSNIATVKARRVFVAGLRRPAAFHRTRRSCLTNCTMPVTIASSPSGDECGTALSG